MDRNQKRILRLRNHVLNHNKDKIKATQEPKREETKDIKVIAYDDMTKAEVSQLLDDKSIKYNPRDNKGKLIDLLLGSD